MFKGIGEGKVETKFMFDVTFPNHKLLCIWSVCARLGLNSPFGVARHPDRQSAIPNRAMPKPF